MSKRDPHNIKQRLEKQIDLLLNEMEENPSYFDFKMRLGFVQIVGMYLTRQLKLASDESDTAGSAVRKYASAFRTNASRGGKTGSRPRLAYSDSSDDDEPA